MNLSCLFGHSTIKKETNLLIIENARGQNWLYKSRKVRLETCTVCKKHTSTRLGEEIHSDYLSKFNNILDNIVLKIVDKNSIPEFLKSYKHQTGENKTIGDFECLN